jgi:hypothetical protein
MVVKPTYPTIAGKKMYHCSMLPSVTSSCVQCDLAGCVPFAFESRASCLPSFLCLVMLLQTDATRRRNGVCGGRSRCGRDYVDRSDNPGPIALRFPCNGFRSTGSHGHGEHVFNDGIVGCNQGGCTPGARLRSDTGPFHFSLVNKRLMQPKIFGPTAITVARLRPLEPPLSKGDPHARRENNRGNQRAAKAIRGQVI